MPWNFPQWEAASIRPRRGGVTMIAATPAAGKTMIVTKLVQRFREPTLFFSADTDDATMLVRAAAMATGERQSDIRVGLAEGGEDYYAKQLAQDFADVRFVFESDPTYEDLELETAAFAEVYGAMPSVIVIDNLMNLVGENENEWASMRDSTKAVKRLARLTGASVFVLHHMSENNARPNYPSPRRDIQGKVSQLPELIISLAASESGDSLRACAVKNRFGVGDPTGSAWVEVPVDLDRCAFAANKAMLEAGILL
jgi:hypothetical protein